MNETEFLDASDAVLEKIQTALDEAQIDVDYQQNGGVLELEFADGGKIIVNRHLPNREIWVAAKSGGFHYAQDAAHNWINTRDGSELFVSLARLVSVAAAEPFSFD
ncbi:iron donor protein CyaY [Paludibacterium yongneupense]|uniref:iron donor protein CyaY n=1 Tax=Paludibacterium yongneupense TaxID=400061 RepID=UPI000419BB8B|nr:iron donor protein CyaY [Paludibacterium yongneupense]